MMPSQRRPEQSLTFDHGGRKWAARLWPNSEGSPKSFWTVKAADQAAKRPTWAEYLAAKDAFGRADIV